MGNSFIPRIGGDIPLKKKPQQSRQDYSFMPGAVNDLLNFTGNTIRTMGDDKIAGLQSQMEGQMRQDYAPPQMTQTPGKASLAAAGMTLLLNMLDTQHKAGQGFAEGFMQAEKAKRDAEYQNAQAKLEEKKRKDATELQITFQRLQQEQKQKDDRMKALQEAIKARRDLAVKESEDERAQKNALELIQARGVESGRLAEEVTKRMLRDKLLNPSTDEKDKLNAFNELNRLLSMNGEQTLNPEDYNIGKSYRQANTEARTQTENELRPGKVEQQGIKTDIMKTERDSAKKRLGWMDEDHLQKVAQARAQYAATMSLKKQRDRSNGSGGGSGGGTSDKSYDPEADKVYQRGIVEGVRKAIQARDMINNEALAIIRVRDRMREPQGGGKWLNGNDATSTATYDGKEYTWEQLNDMVIKAQGEYKIQQEIIKQLKAEQSAATPKDKTAATSDGFQIDKSTGLQFRVKGG